MKKDKKQESVNNYFFVVSVFIALRRGKCGFVIFLLENKAKNGVQVFVSTHCPYHREFKSFLCKCNYLRNHGFYDLFPQKQVQLITSAPDIEITAVS